ncbi:MAG: nitroreductase family deazaflavin-dependent oxidoreductase [Deltaproteobacteria bacterium]|nr:nitroreductase family deazaflavin-dependent oxidoreductase [Deltaproteobacteria bacterium]
MGAVALVRGPAELANAPVRWILRSPLHGVFSSQVLLLELTSRDSRKPYVIPVNYVERGDALLVGSDFDWWRDLEVEPRVRVELRNSLPRTVSARIVRDAAEADAGWRALRPSSWESAVARGAVLIEIALEEAPAP